MEKRFRLLEGTHVHAGRVLKKGDVIRTNLDLVQMFGPNRFVQEGEERPVSVRAKGPVVEDVEEPAEEDAVPTEDVGQEDEGKEAVYGDDVSGDFLMAEGKGALVFLSGDGEYTVTHAGKVVHTAKTKAAVKNFLKQME